MWKSAGRTGKPQCCHEAPSNCGLVQQLQNDLPVGIYTASAHGYLRSVNRALEMWLGYDEGEILARQFGLKELHYRPDAVPVCLGMKRSTIIALPERPCYATKMDRC
jgi:hypothetical protein